MAQTKLETLFSQLLVRAKLALGKAQKHTKKVPERNNLGKHLLAVLLYTQALEHRSVVRATLEAFFIDILVESSFSDDEADWYADHIGNFAPLCPILMGYCMILACGNKLEVDRLDSTALHLCNAVCAAAQYTLESLSQPPAHSKPRNAPGLQTPVTRRDAFSVIKGGKP